MQRNRFQTVPLGGSKARPSMFAACCLYLVAALGITITPLIISVLRGLCARVLPGLDNTFFVDLSDVIFYGAFLVAPLFLYMHPRDSMADALRLSGISTSRAVLCALTGAASVFFTNYLSYLWMMLIEAVGGRLTPSNLALPTTASGLCVMIVFAAVLPGVCEELLFRGAVLSAWEKMGSARAILASTLLFASLHANIEGLPSELVNGLILGIIAVSTDSLFACMIFHTVFNATSLIISYSVQFSAGAAEAAAESASLYASIGGIEGLISVFVSLMVSGALLLWLLRALDRLRLTEGRRVFGIEEGEPHNWQFPELLALCGGVGLMGLWYLYGVLRIAGVIR